MINVIFADDYPIIRNGFSHFAAKQSSINLLVSCASAEEAEVSIFAYKPDVAIIDLCMADDCGISVVRRCLSNDPDARTKFIIYSDTASEHHIARTILAGAHGFCQKSVPHDSLLRTIHLVARGMNAVNGSIISADDIRLVMSNASRCDISGVVNMPLSDREMEVLNLVTKGMSNKEIALALEISSQTVKNHISNVLAKTGARDRTQLAIQAILYGWVQVNPYVFA